MNKSYLLLGLLACSLLSLAVAAQEEFKAWDEGALDTEISKTITQVPSAPDSLYDQLTTSFSAEGYGHKNDKEPGEGTWLAGILAATLLAGVLVRFKVTRYARPFFLVASVVFLGFYQGSCPCPLSGLQETILFVSGQSFRPAPLLWFLALIPITYFLGRVWCGWVCHFGALQDLVHLPARFDFLNSVRAQKILYHIRIVILVALITQLLVTHTKIWNAVDPFKTAFNLFATNTISWILLGLLLVTSVLTYRPFCKVLCPVGLVLGWVSKIPGAAVIGVQLGCIGCKSCSKACKSHAFTYDDKAVVLDNKECIACGECIDACTLHAAHLTIAETTHSVKVVHNRKQKREPA